MLTYWMKELIFALLCGGAGARIGSHPLDPENSG
jgi:hypothetical protein